MLVLLCGRGNRKLQTAENPSSCCCCHTHTDVPKAGNVVVKEVGGGFKSYQTQHLARTNRHSSVKNAWGVATNGARCCGVVVACAVLNSLEVCLRTPHCHHPATVTCIEAGGAQQRLRAAHGPRSDSTSPPRAQHPIAQHPSGTPLHSVEEAGEGHEDGH